MVEEVKALLYVCHRCGISSFKGLVLLVVLSLGEISFFYSSTNSEVFANVIIGYNSRLYIDSIVVKAVTFFARLVLYGLFQDSQHTTRFNHEQPKLYVRGEEAKNGSLPRSKTTPSDTREP